MKLGKKGRATAGVAENMLALLVIVALAFVTIQVGYSLQESTSAAVSSVTVANEAHEAFSGGLWDAYQLMSLTPYLIGALVIIGLVVGFAQFVGGGRM